MTFISRFVAFRSSKAFILFTICFATFSDGFTYGIVTPVLPFLLKQEHLLINNNGTSYRNQIQKAAGNYLPTSIVQLTTSILIAAFSLADMFGARKFNLGGSPFPLLIRN